MGITRREFGRLALTSTAVSLLPLKAFAGTLGNFPLFADFVEPEGKVHGTSSKHEVKQNGNPKFIKTQWNCDWTNDTKMTWETVDGRRIELPSDLVLPHGSASLLLDYKGNWVFSGQFQGDPMFVYDADIAFGVQTSELGHLLGFTERGRIDGPFQWTRQGQSGIISDLWPDVVKGYHWTASGSFRPYHKPDEHHHHAIPPPPPPAPSGGGGGGNSAGRDVLNVLTGGIASWF